MEEDWSTKKWNSIAKKDDDTTTISKTEKTIELMGLKATVHIFFYIVVVVFKK